MCETKPFLLEIQCEEIPDRFLEMLCKDFTNNMTIFLKDNFAINPTIETFYSPRKLAWYIKNIPNRQNDQEEIYIGPPKRLCINTNNTATETGLKFAEKMRINFQQIIFTQPVNKKEPCAQVNIIRKGNLTLLLLGDTIPKMICNLHVPKAMHWGNSEFKFVRPIRNILCLFGNDIVNFTIDGVTTSNTTYGHRLFHIDNKKPIKIYDINKYEQILEQADIIASHNKRRLIIQQKLKDITNNIGGKPVNNNNLLDTITKTVECPTIILGQFPKDFLSLPREVIITSLAVHQKAFCVTDLNDNLLPYFLTIANCPNDPKQFIKSGNEAVLKARLHDAAFFFNEDRKKKLLERLSDLTTLTFQQKIGNYWEKTQRITYLAGLMAELLNIDKNKTQYACQTCKCDLTTLMVNEFPELQGIMGGAYLHTEQNDEIICTSVKEHYKPIHNGDSIPSTDIGCIISIADKLDTITSCFAINLLPTGSNDPLALKRSCQGIIRILLEKRWNISIINLMYIALQRLHYEPIEQKIYTINKFKSFFKDRIIYELKQNGYQQNIIHATIATNWSNLADLKNRCDALKKYANESQIQHLSINARRINNILKNETIDDGIKYESLQNNEEKTLLHYLSKLKYETQYDKMLHTLNNLSIPLELFFNSTLVKCDDIYLRKSRLKLLYQIRRYFLKIADFSNL